MTIICISWSIIIIIIIEIYMYIVNKYVRPPEEVVGTMIPEVTPECDYFHEGRSPEGKWLNSRHWGDHSFTKPPNEGRIYLVYIRHHSVLNTTDRKSDWIDQITVFKWNLLIKFDRSLRVRACNVNNYIHVYAFDLSPAHKPWIVNYLRLTSSDAAGNS